MTELASGDVQAGERAEREEMFGFHPKILTEAAGLPRKVSGRDYEAPPGAFDPAVAQNIHRQTGQRNAPSPE